MSKNIKIAYIIIAIIGMALSAYLWWYQVTDQFIPCTGSGCDDVLKSPYGKLFGVPMSVFGVFYYAVIFLLAFQKLFIKDKILNWLMLATILWGILFSVYLRYLEFFVIGNICIWCWGSVVLILILTLLYILENKYATKNIK